MAKNSEYWEKRIASNIWKTYNSLEEKNRDLLELYQDASRNIRNELYDIAEKYSNDSVLSRSDMYKQNHLEKLNKRFEDIVLSLGQATEKSVRDSMKDGFQEVYRNTAVGMGDIDYSIPNKKLMEKLLNEPWRGDNFSSRLWKNQKKLAVGLNDILLTGMQQGKTVTEMAVQLHNFVGQSFNNCHRLVRTETMHYLNNATLQRYKDADVEYVQIWAAQDERTCEVCGSYHGKVYPLDKCPVLPFHPNCRCTIIPCLDDKLIRQYEKANTEAEDGLFEKIKTAKLLGVDKEAVSFDEIDAKSKMSVYNGIKKVFDKFPQIKGHTKKIIYDPDMDAIASSNSLAGILKLSSKFENYDELEKLYNRLVKMEYCPAGTNADSIIIHELGHQLDGLLTIKGVYGGKIDMLGEVRTSVAVQREVLQQLGYFDYIRKERDDWRKNGYKGAELNEATEFSKKEFITEHISTYANENEREFFAECFSEYMTSKKPREAARIFGEILEEIVGDLE